MTEVLLNMKGFTKTFRENGAGKSTLMHILAGEITAGTGKIVFGNRKVYFELLSDALKTGIGMLHQHFQLIPELTILKNIIRAFHISLLL
jgi:simple sugar transport system ATP-binding protein